MKTVNKENFARIIERERLGSAILTIAKISSGVVYLLTGRPHHIGMMVSLDKFEEIVHRNALSERDTDNMRVADFLDCAGYAQINNGGVVIGYYPKRDHEREVI